MTTSAHPCPICDGPFDPDPRYGYSLDGERTSICEVCHGTLMQITLKAQMDRRRPFWKARGTEAMRKRIHQAVLEARGLQKTVVAVNPFEANES